MVALKCFQKCIFFKKTSQPREGCHSKMTSTKLASRSGIHKGSSLLILSITYLSCHNYHIFFIYKFSAVGLFHFVIFTSCVTKVTFSKIFNWNMSMHWLVGSNLFILILDLERTMNFVRPIDFIVVMRKKVLNRDSISNESNVSCEGYGLPGGHYKEPVIMHIPSINTHPSFSNFIHQKEKVGLD